MGFFGDLIYGLFVFLIIATIFSWAMAHPQDAMNLAMKVLSFLFQLLKAGVIVFLEAAKSINWG